MPSYKLDGVSGLYTTEGMNPNCILGEMAKQDKIFPISLNT